MKSNSTVDQIIAESGEAKGMLELLRSILLETELEETVKWGGPVYTLGGKKVVGMGAFKSYVGLWFFQGVFLSDPFKVLINAQEGVTRGLRQWRFEGHESMEPEKILFYILEAIQNQKEGKEITPKSKKAIEIPDEIKAAFEENENFKLAFQAMTPGRQREYCEYISEAKRAETRDSRMRKVIEKVLGNQGLNDKYR